jgi:hypothetical protein
MQRSPTPRQSRGKAYACRAASGWTSLCLTFTNACLPGTLVPGKCGAACLICHPTRLDAGTWVRVARRTELPRPSRTSVGRHLALICAIAWSSRLRIVRTKLYRGFYGRLLSSRPRFRDLERAHLLADWRITCGLVAGDKVQFNRMQNQSNR